MNVEAISKLSGALRDDGVVCVRNALDSKSLSLAQAAFDWSLAHPSPAANRYAGGEGTFYQDLANPKGKESGCALIGGETAEMPGLYAKGDFDLAGFAVGAVERDAILPKTATMTEGDVLIGIASSGVHSNGYSLVRKVVEKSGLTLDAPAPFAPDKSLGEALLTPTRLYVKPALAAMAHGVKGLAHITGGGITDNLPRCLPDGLDAEVNLDAIAVLPVFSWLARQAGIAEREMLRTFNCGIGMVAVVEDKNADAVIAAFGGGTRIGKLVKGSFDGASAASRDGAGEAKVVYRGALKL